MITAHKLIEKIERNADYNIERSLAGSPITKEEGRYFVDWLLAAIDKAAKFDLGRHPHEDASVLRKSGVEQLQEGILAIPYPYTYTEITVAGEIYQSLYVPLADLTKVYTLKEPVEGWDIDIDKSYVAYQFRPSGKDVEINLLSPIISLWDGQIGMYAMKNMLSMIAAIGNIPINEEQTEELIGIHNNTLGAMQALLSARGVDVVKEEAPARLNKARIAKGRTPLYDHHVVKLGGISSGGKVIGVGMERASPRKHWRRGHVRVLRRGEDNELKTVIPACLINGRGFISKEYEV